MAVRRRKAAPKGRTRRRADAGRISMIFFVGVVLAALVVGFYFLAAYKIIDFSPDNWFRKEALIKGDESLYLNQDARIKTAPAKTPATTKESARQASEQTQKPVYEKNDREYLDKLLRAK